MEHSIITKFATATTNVTDIDATDYKSTGIAKQETAKSDVLNTALRQATLITYSLARFLSITDLTNVGHDTAASDTFANALQAKFDAKVNATLKIAGIALNADIGRDAIFNLNADGFVKRTGQNTYAIDSNTYLTAAAAATAYAPANRIVGGGTLADTITKDALLGTTTDVGLLKRTGQNTYSIDATTYVPATRKIANSTLANDVALDDLFNVSSVGLLKRTSLNTYVIDATAYAIAARQVGGGTLASDISKDALLGTTTDVGLLKRTGQNTYTIDTATYMAASAGIARSNDAGNTAVKLWSGSSTAYNNIVTKDEGTVYIITE